MEYFKIKYRLLVYFTSLTVCSVDKKALKIKKKSFENDQSAGHFQRFFFLFFHLPDPKFKKFP